MVEWESIPVTDSERDAAATDASFVGQVEGSLTRGPGDAALAARFVAEVAKSGESRKVLGPALAPALVNALAANNDPIAHLDVNVQLLRAIGNLCFDNEDNRDAFADVPASAAAIARVLDHSDSKLLAIACGAILNYSMDHESVQLKLVEADGVKRLVRVLSLAITDPTYASLTTSAISTLSNLLEVEQGINELIKVDGLIVFGRVLKSHHSVLMSPDVNLDSFSESIEVLEAVVGALEYIAENDTIQRVIVSQDQLTTLLDFVDHRPTFAPPASDDTTSVTDAYADIRKRISRIVTLVTMNDSNMVDIPKHVDIMTRFKQWMTLGLHTGKELEEDEIRMSGALCIGNLARSDEACRALVMDHGVADALLALLTMEMERVKAGSALMAAGTSAVNEIKSCVKVIHAVVGAFKNLSIAVADRKVLGQLGIIKPIAGLLDIEVVQPVHFPCIGVLKNLCAGGNELNAFRIITGLEPPANETKVAKLDISSVTPQSKTPLTKLIKHIWKATGDNLTNVRNEGGRVIVNLVRTSHLAGAPQLINVVVQSSGITPLIQIVTGALLTRVNEDQKPTDGSQNELHHHVHFDAVPSDGQVFPVVQNEGLVALILMANAVPTSIPIITKYHASLIAISKKILLSGLPDVEKEKEAAVEVARDSKTGLQPPPSEEVLYSDEVKVNCCLFLGVLASADATFAQIALPEINPVLDKLTKWTSVSNLTAASAVSEKSALAYKEAANRGSATSILSRTGTKSVKRLVHSNVEGGPSTAESVEEGLRLAEAVKRLKGVLERK